MEATTGGPMQTATSSLFWRIFLWMSVVILVIIEVGTRMMGYEHGLFEWLNALFMVSSLIPLYGLAYSYPVLKAFVWKVYLIPNAAYNLGYPVVLVFWPENPFHVQIAFDWTHAIGFIYSGVIVYACFLYAFSRPGIWSKSEVVA